VIIWSIDIDDPAASSTKDNLTSIGELSISEEASNAKSESSQSERSLITSPARPSSKPAKVASTSIGSNKKAPIQPQIQNFVLTEKTRIQNARKINAVARGHEGCIIVADTGPNIGIYPSIT
jgi:hypothetical protein